MNRRFQLFVIYPLLTISMILWAYSYIWAKDALFFYNPLTVICARTIVSALIMFPVLLLMRKQLSIKLKHLPAFLLLAVFEPFLYFIGETTGLDKVDPASTSVIISTIPLFTPIAAFYFLKEKVSAWNIVGIILSLAGIAVMVFDNKMNIQVSVDGLLFLTLAVFAAIGYSVMIKRLPGNYSVFTIIFYQNIIGAILFLPLVFFREYQNIIAIGWVNDAVWSIVKLGIFASTLAFLFYMYALKFMNITKVNIFTNMIPVFTILIMWVVMGVAPEMRKAAGMIVVILGVFVSQVSINKKMNK